MLLKVKPDLPKKFLRMDGWMGGWIYGSMALCPPHHVSLMRSKKIRVRFGDLSTAECHPAEALRKDTYSSLVVLKNLSTQWLSVSSSFSCTLEQLSGHQRSCIMNETQKEWYYSSTNEALESILLWFLLAWQ